MLAESILINSEGTDLIKGELCLQAILKVYNLPYVKIMNSKLLLTYCNFLDHDTLHVVK